LYFELFSFGDIVYCRFGYCVDENCLKMKINITSTFKTGLIHN